MRNGRNRRIRAALTGSWCSSPLGDYTTADQVSQGKR